MLNRMAVLFLGFLRILHIDFHSGCTKLHYHQQRRRATATPPSSPAFVVVCIFDDSYSGVKGNLYVVLVCISFIVWDIDYLFMYLLTICTSF
jgi:hypothetical protein